MPDPNAPRSHLRIQNGDDNLLELVLEPYGRDYWMRPGEVFIITTVGSDQGHPFPGTFHTDEPFEMDYRSGSVTVHFNGVYAQVTDTHGNELECGHQRPDTAAG